MIRCFHRGNAVFVAALAGFFALQGFSEARAGNAGPTIAGALEEREISDEATFSPRFEAVAAKAYDGLRDRIVEKTGLDYLFIYSLLWQHGSQGSRDNDSFTGQFDAVARWTLFASETFGTGAIKLHYFNLHDITNTTNEKFAAALGSIWTTTDSDSANALRAAHWQQSFWGERVKLDVEGQLALHLELALGEAFAVRPRVEVGIVEADLQREELGSLHLQRGP